MKKRIVVCLMISIVFFAMLQAALAQNQPDLRKMPATQKAQIITDSLNKILKLSHVQYNKVYIIALDGINQVAPVINTAAGKMSKVRQLRSILNSTESKLKLVFTNDQFTMYESIKEKAIAYYRQRGQNDSFPF